MPATRILRSVAGGTVLAWGVIAGAGCASPVVEIEYRRGHTFSRSERTAIQRIADQAERDVRRLLPGLPQHLRITVQAGDNVIPETGETGGIGLPAAVYWTVNPNHEGGILAVVTAQLRASLFHEWYHLVRATKLSPQTLAERAVNEGLATAFERDFGGAPTPWGAYPADVAAWTTELRWPGFDLQVEVQNDPVG